MLPLPLLPPPTPPPAPPEADGVFGALAVLPPIPPAPLDAEGEGEFIAPELLATPLALGDAEGELIAPELLLPALPDAEGEIKGLEVVLPAPAPPDGDALGEPEALPEDPCDGDVEEPEEDDPVALPPPPPLPPPTPPLPDPPDGELMLPVAAEVAEPVEGLAAPVVVVELGFDDPEQVRLYKGVVLRSLPTTPKLGLGTSGSASRSVYHQVLTCPKSSPQPTSSQ